MAGAKGPEEGAIRPEAAGAEEHLGGGERMEIVHHGNGKFSSTVHHKDGKVTHHEHASPEELHSHIAQSFGHEAPGKPEAGPAPEYAGGDEDKGGAIEAMGLGG